MGLVMPFNLYRRHRQECEAISRLKVFEKICGITRKCVRHLVKPQMRYTGQACNAGCVFL